MVKARLRLGSAGPHGVNDFPLLGVLHMTETERRLRAETGAFVARETDRIMAVYRSLAERARASVQGASMVEFQRVEWCETHDQIRFPGSVWEPCPSIAVLNGPAAPRRVLVEARCPKCADDFVSKPCCSQPSGHSGACK